VLPNITILIDQLVCMVLHKAKPVIWQLSELETEISTF
jgi:hypothetical protein